MAAPEFGARPTSKMPSRSDPPCWAACGAGRRNDEKSTPAQWVVGACESHSLAIAVTRRFPHYSTGGPHRMLAKMRIWTITNQLRQLRSRQAFGEHDALQHRQGAQDRCCTPTPLKPPRANHGRSSGPADTSSAWAGVSAAVQEVGEPPAAVPRDPAGDWAGQAACVAVSAAGPSTRRIPPRRTRTPSR